jgi:hypothetical protein
MVNVNVKFFDRSTLLNSEDLVRVKRVWRFICSFPPNVNFELFWRRLAPRKKSDQ